MSTNFSYDDAITGSKRFGEFDSHESLHEGTTPPTTRGTLLRSFADFSHIKTSQEVSALSTMVKVVRLKPAFNDKSSSNPLAHARFKTQTPPPSIAILSKHP